MMRDHSDGTPLDLLHAVARRSPDAVAVRSYLPDGTRAMISWWQLLEAATAAATRLHGMSPDRPVVLLVDGTTASVAALVGALASGIDVVLLEDRTSFLANRSPVTALDPPIVIGPAEHAGWMPDRWMGYEELLSSAGVEQSALTGRDGEVLQLTSGSTGVPRMARQLASHVIASGRAYQQLFEVTSPDVVLTAVPLAHSYGLAGLWCALLSGATLVTIPRFSPGNVVAGILDGASVLLGTPLLYRLLAPVLTVRGPAPRLRTALSAGGPMPTGAPAAEIERALGIPVLQIYGTTEAGLIACVPQAVKEWPEGSVGFPAPGVELRFGDGTSGRLAVRTPTMFRGYWGEDHPALAVDGFYDTGDLARRDDDGYVFVLGRKDRVVNVGGRKVSPGRIEEVIGEHPGVREVSVFGVERDDQEEEVHAAVVLAAGATVEDLLSYCRDRSLQPYEIPHRVHVLDRLPRNGMGKVEYPALLDKIRQR